MKTKFFAAFITALMFVGMTNVNAQTTKIGYTNVDYILNNLPDAKDIENKLKTEKAQYDKLLQDKIAAFQTKYEDYQKNGATMSPVIKADREKELQSGQTTMVGCASLSSAAGTVCRGWWPRRCWAPKWRRSPGAGCICVWRLTTHRAIPCLTTPSSSGSRS